MNTESEEPMPAPKAVPTERNGDGMVVRLDSGMMLLVPWDVSAALQASSREDRAAVEIIEVGRRLRWPRTGDEIRIGSLAEIDAYRRAARRYWLGGHVRLRRPPGTTMSLTMR